jgi:hypothetical protein
MLVTPVGTVHRHDPLLVTCSTVHLPTTVLDVVHIAGVVVIANDAVVAVPSFASVARIVIVFDEPGPDVVPLMTPVEEFSVRPVGSDPLATE